MLQPRDRLIVALDVPGASQARQIVQAIGEAATTYKIGKQLFTAEGPQVVRNLVSSGRKVFLDLKFHDIPNTVAAAVRSAAELGVSMMTVHASGGSKMLRAAVEAAGQSAAQPLVLAVTVLTSLSDSDLEELGISGNVPNQVLRLGVLARNAGCGGLVASAQETRELRRELGEDFVIVTPGIRPNGSAFGDQMRVVTPKDAIYAGATYLVVGRPILDAPDPAKAAEEIVRDIGQAAVTVTRGEKMLSANEVCCEIYARTKKFLYEDRAEEDSKRLKEAGFQILMGPPHVDAPILFLGYQPGAGCKTALEEREYGSEDCYPGVCEYATECWNLAKRLRTIFDKSLLQRSVGLNAIFVRADNMATYVERFEPQVRRQIESFCRKCVLEIVEVVRPKKIVVIGFSTLRLFPEAATFNEDVRGGNGVLAKTGRIAGRDTIAVLHLTGSRISNDDRQKIADRLRTFCASN